MGNIDTPTIGKDEEMLDDTERIDHEQAEAAKEATNIQSFKSGFHKRMEGMVGKVKDAAEKRAEVIDSFASDMSDLKLAKTDGNVLGYARIGVQGSARLSEEQFALMETEEDMKRMRQAGAHERAHEKAVQLEGEFVVDGQTIDHELLYEGHAEVNGNEGAGMNMAEHREGQPEEVYAEGQRLAVMIIRKTGREAFEKALTKDGDLSALQGAMAA